MRVPRLALIPAPTITFPEAGRTLAGCRLAGHYGGGMKADITVE
jgi:uncharacterized cupredoxin-like copper-binding protein